MRVALLVAVAVLAAVGAMADGQAEKAVNLDEIEQIDSSVFDDAGAAKSPLEQAAISAATSVRDADVDRDTESVVALAAEAARTGSEDQTMYSFRAMRHASAMAGASISEKSAETHAAALRMLRKGQATSSEEMFAEISREQQMLVAKRALVAHQKQSIADSVESMHRLQRLINENKKILTKNEAALRRGSDDLLKLISKYQSKLRAGLGPAPSKTGAKKPAGPVRTHVHQRAAFAKWGDKGTKSKAQGKGKGKGKGKAAAAKAAGKAAAKSDTKAAAPAKAAAKSDTKQVKPKAPAAKPKFAQVHAAAAEAEEAAAEDEAETEEEAETAEAADSEEEADAESAEEAEEEEEEETDESDAEEEAEEEEEEEESESSLLEAAAYNPKVDRAPAIAGLAPPPPFFHDGDD